MNHRPFNIDLHYDVITPLYLGGAQPDVPELRAASFRGAARAWFRAFHPRFLDFEGRWFGSASDSEEAGPEASGRDEPAPTASSRSAQRTQASPWRIRVVPPPAPPAAPPQRFALTRESAKPYTKGYGVKTRNGVLYTGYTLLPQPTAAHRQALPPGTQVHLRLTFLPHLLDPTTRADAVGAVLSSFWLLGHLGGMGSRSRRGWGSLQLRRVEPRDGAPDWAREEARRLLPARTDSAASWSADVVAVLRQLASRFGSERGGPALDTPHIGRASRVLIARKSQQTWQHALNEIGVDMQDFRASQRPDARRVLGGLLHAGNANISPTEKTPLTHAPARSAFGLPLTFRFAITPKWLKELRVDPVAPMAIEFMPEGEVDKRKLTRHPGPVLLRVVRLSSGHHPVVVRLSGALPGAIGKVRARSPEETAASTDPGSKPTGPTGKVRGRLLHNNRSFKTREGTDTLHGLTPSGPQMLEAWLDELRGWMDEVRP